MASEVRTCELDSSTTASPRSQNVRSATRFAIPHVGTQRPAGLPSSSATRSQSSFTEASSPKVAQPSSAARIASHISAVGTVHRSERRSIIVGADAVPAGPGVLAAVDDRDAVHEHVLDAARVVVRVGDRRDLLEQVVVENDDVRCVAGPEEPAVPEPEVRSRHARHLPDRLLEAKRALLADVVREVVDGARVPERVAEDVGERPLLGDREGVDAEGEERVGDHLRHVLVGEQATDDEDALVGVPASARTSKKQSHGSALVRSAISANVSPSQSGCCSLVWRRTRSHSPLWMKRQ